jgi:hypothetical protein
MATNVLTFNLQTSAAKKQTSLQNLAVRREQLKSSF